ncbi:MAG: hypothetical protein U0W40_07040 [Acidimicrobiia bacterium]
MRDPEPSHDPAGQRAATAAVVVAAAVVGILLVALGPDRSGSSDATVVVAAAPVTTLAPVTTTAAPATPATAATAPPTTAAKSTKDAKDTPTTTTVDPGTLPQTDEKPTASGAQFDAGVQGLWQAIVKDDPSLARPFFFPLSAYQQVKDISDPAGDYQSRLIANYEQDIHSLHAQLGDAASRAQLTGMTVPNDQAQWITPGVEYNKGSYWRVFGSTLNYTVDGQSHSFPVTSLISWRGQWYVVHLGQIR